MSGEDVLGFWFGELRPEQWFKKDAALDQEITRRFGDLHRTLARGVPADWLATARGALAAVIVLDQFPRNMFRGGAAAFATDGLALSVAEAAIARGLDARLGVAERKFLYLPFEHCEDAAAQARSVQLYEALGDKDALDYALRHKSIIDRFQRFPHRNAALGRTSTAEELAFLKEPGSSF
jgi:uncharacterized protein (DUF924 family)